MILEIRDLSKSCGGHRVLAGISHVFPEGRVTVITGPSGRGKTTLLRLIAGLEAPDSGVILGVPDSGVSMVFQEDRLPPRLSAAGCLRCVLKKTPSREERIREALRALGLDEAGEQPVREFSGGMRRRVALARALLYPGELALLDEPFKGLDDGTRDRAIAFARPLLAGRTTLLVTHDPRDADAFGAEIFPLYTILNSKIDIQAASFPLQRR